MKKIIFSLLILSLSTGLSAQKVHKDSSGNYTAVKTEVAIHDTGKTYTDQHGNIFQVFESARGKLFIIRRSQKTGNEYKMYLKD